MYVSTHTQWRSQKNLSTGAHDAVADPGILKRGGITGADPGLTVGGGLSIPRALARAKFYVLRPLLKSFLRYQRGIRLVWILAREKHSSG